MEETKGVENDKGDFFKEGIFTKMGGDEVFLS